MRTPPILPTLAAALCAAAVLPSSAGAASYSVDGDRIVVRESSPGEANRITISVGEDGRIEFGDFAGSTAGAGCEYSEIRDLVMCEPRSIVDVQLGAGDDRLTPLSIGGKSLADGGLSVDLGPGNDSFQGDGVKEQVNGGPGNDEIAGAQGDDVLSGGDGLDKLEGDSGNDRLDGGAGNDTLSGDPNTNPTSGADTIIGGDGTDELHDYWPGENDDPRTAPPVSVTLDGAANDGASGEGDNVTGVESVDFERTGNFRGDDGANSVVVTEIAGAGTFEGLGGADRLTAGDASGDRIDGGAGDDELQGGFGDDTVTGGPGRDRIASDRPARCNEVHCDVTGGYGNDRVEARDGEVDSVECGPGEDTVIADAADTVAPNCENVQRSAGPPPPCTDCGPVDPITDSLTAKIGSVKLRKALSGGLPVAVQAPAAGKLSAVAKQGRKTVATTSAKVSAAGKVTVKLRFTKAAKKALARKRKVALSVRVTFTPAGGGAKQAITAKGTLKR
jgi:hypothetical protein